MHRFAIMSTLLVLSSLTSGCFGGDKSPASQQEVSAPAPVTAPAPAAEPASNPVSEPAPVVQTPPAAPAVAAEPTWILRLKSACIQTNSDQCVARYGYTIRADGKYEVGPGPRGQLHSGTLSEAQLATLNQALQGALATAKFGPENPENHETGVENEGDDTLTLSRQDKQDTLLHNTGPDFYFATAKLAEVQPLHNAIRDLAKSHYRLPFGNDCGDASDKVEALYSSVAGCQTDSDCVYVDAQREYEIIVPNSEQWVFTEDCRAIAPLLVANKTQIQASAKSIVESYLAASQTCGDEFYRYYCDYEQKETKTAPVCVQNRCQSKL